MSTRVAKHFPGLFESAIVLSYKDALPNNSGFYWGRVKSAHKHTLRSRRLDIDNSTIHPTLDVTRVSAGRHGGGLVGGQALSGAGSALRQLTAKRSMQTIKMSGEDPDSFGQWLSRSVQVSIRYVT